MRTLLKVTMDVDAANAAIESGQLQKIMESLHDLIHPEASYFTADGGRRTAFFFFQLADPSDIPRIAEPLFRVLRAEVDLRPVMNPEELLKGLQASATQRKAA